MNTREGTNPPRDGTFHLYLDAWKEKKRTHSPALWPRSVIITTQRMGVEVMKPICTATNLWQQKKNKINKIIKTKCIEERTKKKKSNKETKCLFSLLYNNNNIITPCCPFFRVFGFEIPFCALCFCLDVGRVGTKVTRQVMTTTAADIITRDQQASISTRRSAHAGDLLSVLLLLLYSFSSFHLLNDMLRKGEKTSFYYEMQYDCLYYTHIVDGRHTSSIYSQFL